MRIIDGERDIAEVITHFDSRGAASVHLGSGAGDAHVYVVYVDPGGEIGPHEAGFDQLFVVVDGEGWAASADGARVPVACGQAARFERGETHSKGSETGMTAIMVQIEALAPVAD